MNTDLLATYLGDHLAGSVAAIELLDHICDDCAGTPAGEQVAQIRADVTADRDELQLLVHRVPVSSSAVRKATAWIAEKAMVVKLRVDDPTDGALRHLEAVEAICLALAGKSALWRGLASVASDVPGVSRASTTSA